MLKTRPPCVLKGNLPARKWPHLQRPGNGAGDAGGGNVVSAQFHRQAQDVIVKHGLRIVAGAKWADGFARNMGDVSQGEIGSAGFVNDTCRRQGSQKDCPQKQRDQNQSAQQPKDAPKVNFYVLRRPKEDAPQRNVISQATMGYQRM